MMYFIPWVVFLVAVILAVPIVNWLENRKRRAALAPAGDDLAAGDEDALGGMFADYSIEEKREMVSWNLVFLEGEKGRRAGTVEMVDTTGNQELLHRLADEELDHLIKIRSLYAEADGQTGMPAIALYRQIEELAPWDEICPMTIGVEYANAGQMEDAIPWLEKAMAMNPENERVRTNYEGIMAAAEQS